MMPLASAEHAVNIECCVRIRREQVLVELKVYEGLAHGFSALENGDVGAFVNYKGDATSNPG